MLSAHWLLRYPSNWEPRISRKCRRRTRSPAPSAHRWKFRPSSRTTTQQCGKQVSSASKSRTYSNLLLAMVTPSLRNRLKVTEVAAKRLPISAALKGHIPHGEALDGPHPGSSCRRRSRSSHGGGFSLHSPVFPSASCQDCVPQPGTNHSREAVKRFVTKFESVVVTLLSLISK